MTEDCQTRIGPWIDIADAATLVRLLRYVGAGDAEIAEVEENIQARGRGSVFITLIPGRKNLLRLREPWCEGLG